MPTLTWEERNELAQQFAPRLVLFPEQQELGHPGKDAKMTGDYHPRAIQLLLARGILSAGFLHPKRTATVEELAASNNPKDQLIMLNKPLPNPEHAWRMYFDLLASGRTRFPLTTYARVQTRGEANAATLRATDLGENALPAPEEVGRPFFKPDRASQDDIAIQYWLCYYYDDWANQHEGDWEGICIFLRREGAAYQAIGASYYAHETGKRRHWAEVTRAGDTHPLVYVAAGSHASYFQYVDGGYVTTVKDFIVPVLRLKLKIGLATARVDRVPNQDEFAPVSPRVELLPDPMGPPDTNDPAWEHLKWLKFPGTWGINVLDELGYGGPLGPSHKKLKWHNPFAWMERYCSPDYLVY